MSEKIQKNLPIEGLCCVNCAAKIERELSTLRGIHSASLNLAASVLSLEMEIQADHLGTLNQISAIMSHHEPNLRIKKSAPLKAPQGILSQFNAGSERIVFVLGTGIFAGTLIFQPEANIRLILFLTSYVLLAKNILAQALKNIFRGQFFDENFLMSLASIGALMIGEFPEGIAVILFYRVGEFFQNLAVHRSKKSIEKLMDIRPDFANLLSQGGEIRVTPEQVQVGDRILIKPGEKVPLDGKIIQGESILDTSILTGESLPVPGKPGDSVLSGSINQTGLLTLEVSKPFGESTLSKILELVQNSGNKKAHTEKFMTRFARYYTPLIVSAAVLLALIPPLWIAGAEFETWLNRALVFLVVSCPCALVLSIPLTFFGGIGGASRNGILIKGGNYLEALNHLETVAFDKTGTLTQGVFQVTGIFNENWLSKEELISYAALAENASSHPIALSILRAYGKDIDPQKISSCHEIPGSGVKARIEGKVLLAGNLSLMKQEHIACEEIHREGTLLYLAVDHRYAGCIVMEDQIKEDSAEAIRALRKQGVKNLVMLTGDRPAVGKRIAEILSLDSVYCGLLPHEKVEILEKLETQKKSKNKIAFVGDGINDAPVLARADIGIAMGALGSDAAIEAADIVLMTDEPLKLAEAVKIAKKTRRIVWQNIFFALGVKAVILFLGAAGIATLWEAVFGDVGVALLAIFNAMRVMRRHKKPALKAR